MFRLLGFLVGSAMAIVLILLIIGMPDFHMSDSAIDQQRFDGFGTNGLRARLAHGSLPGTSRLER